MSLRFEDGFLRKLEYLSVISRRAFAGRDRADRLARKRGAGLEFNDHRAYSAGDDFRHIDWKAYKRINRLLVRLFDEEQDLPIYLFLDVSRSMAATGKFDQARRLAAALCYIGLAHLDRVTLLPFGGGMGSESQPGRGKGRIFAVFDWLDALEPAGETNLAGAFAEFAGRDRQRGMAVVISDFLDVHGVERGLRLLASIGHDVFAVHVTSAVDRDPGMLGETRVVDAETGEHRDIDITPALAEAYRAAWETHAASLERFCASYQIGYVRADAERPFEDVILKAFRQGRFLS